MAMDPSSYEGFLRGGESLYLDSYSETGNHLPVLPIIVSIEGMELDAAGTINYTSGVSDGSGGVTWESNASATIQPGGVVEIALPPNKTKNFRYHRVSLVGNPNEKKVKVSARGLCDFTFLEDEPTLIP